MRASRKIFFSWLPLAVAVTGLAMLVQLTVQQNYRQLLNDPQIQMAEDLANEMNSLPSGSLAAIEDRVSAHPVNIANDLAPWSGIYALDGEGGVGTMATAAILNGGPAMPPAGVFDINAWKGPIVDHHLISNPNENRVTWQPQADVREAIVIVPFQTPSGIKGFAVAGRNMREVEDREGALGTIVLLAWICIMGATLVAKALAYYLA